MMEVQLMLVMACFTIFNPFSLSVLPLGVASFYLLSLFSTRAALVAPLVSLFIVTPTRNSRP